VPIVGCGGIASGLDVYEHFLAGATAVQIGSTLMKEGPDGGSTRILAELKDLLIRKGVASLDSIVPLVFREEKL
jgi:dihydroorotate dehydrogenase (fumarate)